MFLQAGSPAELRAYMAQYPDSRCIAGGTDIMPVQNRENDREAVCATLPPMVPRFRI